jgi:selenocysteine-specific translation elongation factor
MSFALILQRIKASKLNHWNHHVFIHGRQKVSIIKNENNLISQINFLEILQESYDKKTILGCGVNIFS